jgi:hypothetical protein
MDRSIDKGKRDRTYKAMFYLSVEIMIVAIILAAIIKPQAVISTLSIIPYIAAGIVLLILVSFAILSIHSSKPLSRDDKKEPLIV